MVETNLKYQTDAGNLCKKVNEAEIRVHSKALLEAFVQKTVDVIEIDSVYHSETLFPNAVDSPEDLTLFAAKILIGLIRGPPTKGLDDSFFETYLKTDRNSLEDIVLRQYGIDATAQAALFKHTLDEKELKITHEVCKTVLPYLTVVTHDYQEYIDLLERK